MRASAVLYVGRDPALHETLSAAAQAVPLCQLEACFDLHELPSRLQETSAKVVILHAQGDETADGRPLEQQIVQFMGDHPQVALLIVSDVVDADASVNALRLGVADYLARPLDANRLVFLLDLLTVNARYGSNVPSVTGLPNGVRDEFLVNSASMRRLMEQVQRVAHREATIILAGETGTGKTRLAQVIHRVSPRYMRPFVTVNCGTLSPALIESEIFGHAKGAFTGADRAHVGKFEQAADGTLLLDEVDTLPQHLQVKLLRVVDERAFEPVGSTQTVRFRARLIVATNRDLESVVAAGQFRADLYHRFNILSFRTPALRERSEEIPLLAEHFLKKYADEQQPSPRRFSRDVLQTFKKYPWPGNIRELRNTIERVAAVCTTDEVQLDDLPDSLLRWKQRHCDPMADTMVNVHDQLDAARQMAERERLSSVITQCNNNRSLAAQQLGISRMTLYKKLHKYNLG